MAGRDPGLVIAWIGGNCPVQAEGTLDNAAFYFRSRGNAWTLSVGGADIVGNPDWHYREDYGVWPDAGWITEEQARDFIDKAVALYRAGTPSMDTGWKVPSRSQS